MRPKQIPLVNPRRVPIQASGKEFVMAEQVSPAHDSAQPVRVIVWYDYI